MTVPANTVNDKNQYWYYKILFIEAASHKHHEMSFNQADIVNPLSMRTDLVSKTDGWRQAETVYHNYTIQTSI